MRLFRTLLTAGVSILATASILTLNNNDNNNMFVSASIFSSKGRGDDKVTVSADSKVKDLQSVEKHGDITTMLHGANVADDNNSHRAGRRGPLLMEDVYYRVKMHHFDHEPIPERVVHARGSGAHGIFKLTKSLSQYTKAAVLNDVGVETPVFVRFSTVIGNRGSADTVRDVRGFATKFYTSQGNWDLVGNNIPVFFIQDAIKFPDLVHAAKPENDNEIPQAQTAHDNFYDYSSLQTETAHMVMWTSSDRAIPRSYRMMQGFGVHTYALINSAGNRVFVKFHWRPLLGVYSFVWDEAQKIIGVDPDFHRRDLWEAIETGNYPEWELGVQIFSDTDAFSDFDALDATKIVPEELVPIQWGIGRLILNRNPSEFFAETEQVAFGVHNLVPGIDATNDPLLQGRLFSYIDTNIRRHNTINFDQLPINRPLCPVMNNMRGGNMQMFIHPGKTNYFPNRFNTPHPLVGPVNGGDGEATTGTSTAAVVENYMENLQGMVTRLRGPKFANHFSQATLFYRSLSPVEQEHIQQALSFELSKVADEATRARFINNILNRIDNSLAVIVANNVGVTPLPSPPSGYKYNTQLSPHLSQFAYAVNNSIATRKIAILISDGYNKGLLDEVMTVIQALGAIPVTVGPRAGALSYIDNYDINERGDLKPNGVKANFTLFNCRSVLFDAVLVLDTSNSATSLLNGGAPLAPATSVPNPRGAGAVLSFIAEAYKHYKVIGVIGARAIHIMELLGLDNVTLASKTTAAQVVDSMGVVSTYNIEDGYGKSSPSPAVTYAGNTDALIKNGFGDVFGVDGARFMRIFLGRVARHRYWDRDVANVPA